jgi:hypothetical protein
MIMDNKKVWLKIGLLVCLLMVFTLGYGGGCNKKSDKKDVVVGSSTPAPALTYKVVYADSANNLKRIPIAGGTSVDLATSVASFGITFDNTKVLYTTASADLKVMPISGGSSTTLANNVSSGALTSDSATVVYNTTSNDLKAVSIGGGTSTNLATDVIGYSIEPNKTQ